MATGSLLVFSVLGLAGVVGLILVRLQRLEGRIDAVAARLDKEIRR